MTTVKIAYTNGIFTYFDSAEEAKAEAVKRFGALKGPVYEYELAWADFNKVISSLDAGQEVYNDERGFDLSINTLFKAIKTDTPRRRLV
jgi:hypothetical protein